MACRRGAAFVAPRARLYEGPPEARLPRPCDELQARGACVWLGTSAGQPRDEREAPPLHQFCPHLLNLIVAPVCTYIHGLSERQVPQWTDTLTTHLLAVQGHIEKEVPHTLEEMDLDTWTKLHRKSIRSIVHVDVDERHIKEVLAPIVPWGMDLTPCTQRMLMLTSPVMSKLVGGCLHCM